MLLRARIILPITSPPLENGAVWIEEGRVRGIGSFTALRKSGDPAVRDLGEVVLLPGLINAHCHLDYTDMAGQVPAMRHFSDWIKSITTLKATWSYSEFAASWVRGARMLLDSGVTTVGDIEAVPELLPEAWNSTPLRIFSFLEMTGVKSRRNPAAILEETCAWIDQLPHGRCWGGLSPHAPYSTTPALLRLAAERARQCGWRIMTHVAESLEEYEMFFNSTGTLYEWLKRNERDMSDCGGCSPIEQLAAQRLLGPNFTAVHANYLGPKDDRHLAESGASVIHCPGSHQFFGHDPFPYERLKNSKIPIGLGTDSLASQIKRRDHGFRLNMFDEMRLFSRAFPDVPPEQILRMATWEGACTLGLQKKTGMIQEGAWADLIAIPFSGSTAAVYDTLLSHDDPVPGVMIDGKWVRGPLE